MADTFAKYHCNYCEEDVNGLRVRCLECEDFDLCLQCFSCGAEIGKHKRSHGYQFMAGVFQDTGNFSIFPGQGHWTAREEVRLLDAIEQYGYGNWEDIARHIETRTPEDARNKYISSYIEGNIGRVSWKPAMERLQLPIEHTTTDTGPLSPTLGSSLPTQPLSSEENTILGYMPHRDDFERVDMYMRRLRERSRRKRVVRDFQIVPQFFKKEKEKVQVPPKKKSKDDRDSLAEKLRPVSQFQTASEHNNLISSMVRERELRTRIKELLRYRRNGIRHVEECHEFEVARARRDKKKENKKKAPSIHNFAFHAGQPASDSNDSNGPVRKVKRVSVLACCLCLCCRNDARSPKCLAEKKFTPLDTGGGKWLSASLSGSVLNGSDGTNNWGGGSSTAQGGPGGAAGASDDPVPISSLPGYHLLSQRERKLCSATNIKPSQYIAYKAVLLKDEGDKQQSGVGPSTRRGACTPQGLDSQAQRMITNFMTQAGWISSFT
ncbi:Transcriptional adapter 2B [Portunus trituberculatus]|uniref:Transcriptional adapter n=1 Tax=Portunus trituberculatus TaxID=210409 RepID=A0A5B7CRM0_PORTR|nr:Transcriptional adapter 2B [Portunus trituberculatus]